MASDKAVVTRGELPFYRGGGAALRGGPAYFISSEMMAKFYGPVTEYRLRLKNPKFVGQREWGRFDSIAMRLDPSPIEELYAEGYDSAVWAKNTPVGRMYTVFALNGKAVSKPFTSAQKVASRYAAIGQCYPWASKFAWDREDAVVVHGTIVGPDRQARIRPLEHAWVEWRGKVYDWQTVEMLKKPPMRISEYRKKNQAVEHYRLSGEEAFICSLRSGKKGPWTEAERAFVMGKR